MEKNIFILHSLNGDTLSMWGKDIKDEFSQKGFNVTMPEFPIRADSKYEKFETILEKYIENGDLNSNSIVAPGAVYEYPSSRTDYIVEVKKQAYVKKKSLDYMKNIECEKYCLYSDEDDKNIEKFTRFIDDTNSKGIYLKNYNHFDGYHDIYKVPELNELINSLL